MPVGQIILMISLTLSPFKVTIPTLPLVVVCCQLVSAVLGSHNCYQNQEAHFHGSTSIFLFEHADKNQQSTF